METPDISPDFQTTHPLKIFDAARSQRRYLYAAAPMVRYSKLAFRQTVHHFGTDLTWTPMVLAKEFNRNALARDTDLTLSTDSTRPQPPTIIQYGSNSPLEFSRAALLAAPFVCGVDLNCGCPQSWACAETLGAALMNRRELVRDMVVDARAAMARGGWPTGRAAVASPAGRSLSVKIRVHADLRKTVDFVRTVVGDPLDPNVDFLTIHPRTRSTPSSTPIMLESLTLLTSMFGEHLPILLSGDIFSLDSLPPYPDAPAPPSSESPAAPAPRDSPVFPPGTKLAGVMSARGILANPALYAGHRRCPWEAVEVFIGRVVRCPLPLKLTVHHLEEMCGAGMGRDKRALLTKDERRVLHGLTSMVDVVDFLDDKMVAKVGRPMRRDL